MSDDRAERLIASAEAMGINAGPVDVDDIIVDPRVRMKCVAPRCDSYGTHLMCPPDAPTLSESREMLSAYSVALLIQMPIPVSKDAIEDADMRADGNYHVPMRESLETFNRNIALLEREAFLMGNRFAAAIGSAPCSLCEECVGPGGVCRNPFQSRPSMQSLGIDVFETARRAGMPISIPPGDNAKWTGLLLVD